MENMNRVRNQRRAVLKFLYDRRNLGAAFAVSESDCSGLGITHDELGSILTDLETLGLIGLNAKFDGGGKRYILGIKHLTRQGLLSVEGMDDRRYELLGTLYKQRDNNGLSQEEIAGPDAEDGAFRTLLDLELLGLAELVDKTNLEGGKMIFIGARITGKGILAYEGVLADPRQNLNTFVTTNFYSAHNMQLGEGSTQHNTGVTL